MSAEKNAEEIQGGEWIKWLDGQRKWRLVMNSKELGSEHDNTGPFKGRKVIVMLDGCKQLVLPKGHRVKTFI